MESLKSDYFLAICNLARAGDPLDEFGITSQLKHALIWYLNGPPLYAHLLYKPLLKAVTDARLGD